MRSFFNRRIALVVGLVICGAFVVLVIAFGTVTRESRQRRHDICVQVQQLKAAQRAQAVADYKRLGVSLRLLHLKKTPAIVLAAKQNRDEILRRFAAQDCPD